MSLHARGASRPEAPPVGGRRTVFGQRLTQMGHHRHSSTNHHHHHHSHCHQWWLIILLLLEVTRHFGKCASDFMILNKIYKTNLLMLQVENRTDVTPQRLSLPSIFFTMMSNGTNIWPFWILLGNLNCAVYWVSEASRKSRANPPPAAADKKKQEFCRKSLKRIRSPQKISRAGAWWVNIGGSM